MTGQKEVLPVCRNFGMCCEKRGNIDETRRVLEVGRHVAAKTIEGSVRWKVEIDTYLALLLYRNYPEEISTADELSREVFDMSKELKMQKWRESAVLETFYKRNRHAAETLRGQYLFRIPLVNYSRSIRGQRYFVILTPKFLK